MNSPIYVAWLDRGEFVRSIHRAECRREHPRTGAVCQKDKGHSSRVHIGTDVHGKTVMWEERR